MAELLGADVEALDQIVQRLKNASQAADNCSGSVGGMAGELQFYGRYGDDFVGFLQNQLVPALGKVAQALTALGDRAHEQADAQREVSNGNAATAGAVLTGAAGIAGVGAATLGQRRQPGGQRPAPPADDRPHYTLRNASIHIDRQETKDAFGRVADTYYQATSSDLTVTDGDRTPGEQAHAMYNTLRSGTGLGIYRQRAAAAEIETAYNQAVAARQSPSQIQAAMTDVIQNQVDRGVYISDHLRGDGIDVRSGDITNVQAFKNAAAAEGFSVVDERNKPNNPHWHLQR